MKLIDLFFALLMTVLGLFTGGCIGNHRLYIGVEDYDTVTEQRTTKDKGIWERITGGNGHGSPMSGGN